MSSMLMRKVSTPVRGGVSLSGRRCTPRLVARAEVKEGRTFREEGADAPPANEESNKAMFADEVLAQRAKAPKPKSNLSPEMKSKLKSEYVGLGGTADKAMGGNYFLYIILIISVLAVLSKLTGAI